MISGGTDSHLILADVRPGDRPEDLCELVHRDHGLPVVVLRTLTPSSSRELGQSSAMTLVTST